ncbi:uncharacterized protein [Eurosta solidaginis]|uniref:uncharacterized protein n=1 Tax=Eurosta solidaginis TaxID=178769 RepID=UPI003530768B
MKYFIALALLVIAFAGAMQNPPSPFDDDSEVEIIVDDEEGTQAIAPAFILSWQARRAIRRFQKQMPCGFPQYGIPPLAPLKKKEAVVNVECGVLDTKDLLTKFRVDGLDNFKINRFKLNLILSKINFDFNFREIKVSAPQYNTETIIDLLQEIGVKLEFVGAGALDFAVKNLRVVGVLKYKIPVLWGSIKIKSLKVTVTLGDAASHITGILGEGKLNDLLNEKMEQLLVSSINDNKNEISASIENTVVPRVNKLLKGNNFWTLLDWILSSDDAENEDDPIKTKCVAPADPWV